MRARRALRRSGILFALAIAGAYAASAVTVGLVVAAVHETVDPKRSAASTEGRPPPGAVLAICHLGPDGAVEELWAPVGSALEAQHRAHGDWVLTLARGQVDACQVGAPEMPSGVSKPASEKRSKQERHRAGDDDERDERKKNRKDRERAASWSEEGGTDGRLVETYSWGHDD